MILEAVLQAKPDQAIGQGDKAMLVDNRSKRRGNYMLKPGRKRGGQMEEEINKDYQKGDESRVLVQIWDMRSWAYEGELGDQCNLVEDVKMVRAEVDKSILPRTQAEFKYMESGGFESMDK